MRKLTLEEIENKIKELNSNIQLLEVYSKEGGKTKKECLDLLSVSV